MRDRLVGAVAEEMREYMLIPALRNAIRESYDGFNTVNKAHLLMLVRQGIMDRESGKLLAKVLANMPSHEEMLSLVTPDNEDLFYNIEAYLISKTSLQIAGQLHTARSRNDLAATSTRLRVRELYLESCEMILEIARLLIGLARQEAETVMTGYTHLQPAEPITAGHYFWGVAEALERDYERVEEVYKRLNLCPLGAGASCGTSFPVDREYTAACMGFDGIVENTIDAVISRDYMLELLADYALVMTTLSRMVQDLYIWNSDEFRSVELPDSVASSSSIMPQKKNPVTLETLRATSGQVVGALIDALFVHKGTSFAHCKDISTYSVKPFSPAYESMKSALALLKVTLDGLEVHRERVASRAGENYTTMTELANNLVRRLGISFRHAHEVVALLVARSNGMGLRSNDITAEMLVSALERKGVSVGCEVAADIVAASLDPVKNAYSKNVKGGPAPDRVREGVQRVEAAFNRHAETLATRKHAVEQAGKRLDEMVRKLGDGDLSALDWLQPRT